MQNIKRIKQDTSGVEPKALTIIRVTSSTTKIIQKLHILYGKGSTCVIIKNFHGILKISSITSHCLGNELVLPPQRDVRNNDHTQDNGVNWAFPEASDINCNFFLWTACKTVWVEVLWNKCKNTKECPRGELKQLILFLPYHQSVMFYFTARLHLFFFSTWELWVVFLSSLLCLHIFSQYCTVINDRSILN